MNLFAFGPRAIAEFYAARDLRVHVAGAHHVPRRGPALLVARHYHHLYDGAALLHGLPRQPHLFVALDWTSGRLERLVMETVCNLAEWPVALRSANLEHGRNGSFARDEVRRYTRRALERAAALLRRGELVLVFPEGYPAIEPGGSRQRGEATMLPFAPGFAAIAALAARTGTGPVPIVPIGLAYRADGARQRVQVRLGEPVRAAALGSRAALVADVERAVRALSG